jgi:NAD(P)-dependent dehydrogenase (short-subunit alcohol dehydrogenase family)
VTTVVLGSRDPAKADAAAGDELMFAVNHLGHFALVSHLAPLLCARPGSRMVTTGSFVAKRPRRPPDQP